MDVAQERKDTWAHSCRHFWSPTPMSAIGLRPTPLADKRSSENKAGMLIPDYRKGRSWIRCIYATWLLPFAPGTLVPLRSTYTLPPIIHLSFKF